MQTRYSEFDLTEHPAAPTFASSWVRRMSHHELVVRQISPSISSRLPAQFNFSLSCVRQVLQVGPGPPYRGRRALLFLHLESRQVSLTGITKRPDQEWIEQIARSATQRPAKSFL